jgi:2'-5' RNA ligase
MKSIAIDIVLLLPTYLEEKVIGLCGNLEGPSSQKLILNKSNSIPHITLAMGAIQEDSLQEIKQNLPQIKNQYLPLNLSILGPRTSKIETGQIITELKIKEHQTLTNLHQDIMKMMAPYLLDEITSDMFAGGQEINPMTLVWINSYQTKDYFSPHITIGYGKLPEDPSLENFTSEQLAIFQMGNNCTCAQKIADIL